MTTTRKGLLREAARLLRGFVGRSLRNRLILLTTLSVGLGALVSSLVVYQVAQNSLYTSLDDELRDIATSQEPIVAAQIASNNLPTSEGFQVENVLLAIYKANRESIVQTGTVPLAIGEPEIALARLGVGTRARTGVRQDNVPYRIVAVPFSPEGTKDRYVLVLGRDLTSTNRTLMVLQVMQWIAGLIGIAVGGVTGVALARSSLSTIRQLGQGVARIETTDQLRPLPVEGNDEVAALGRSFNSLVASLAVSRERQRRLIADASHELRTPLTSLRTNVELLIADEDSGMLPAGARSHILRDIAEQLAEFTALIGDLVALSREEGLPPVNLARFDFREVVERAVARALRRGPRLQFDVRLESLPVVGDEAALERAVTNLLDNAVKFSPEHGRVWVRLEGNELRIRDEGLGIADTDLPHIFERFYRSDRSRNTPGTGLGLSIVDHTVTSHGGTVNVVRPPGGGTEFVVTLPDVDESA
ncbi:MAG: HAMP domain-containing histidine kinase [Propionibacteriaceae bacterium]|nr:HAMP domain-containing histidine kinase [Propionibacteriaceae bacterium]